MSYVLVLMVYARFVGYDAVSAIGPFTSQAECQKVAANFAAPVKAKCIPATKEKP